VNKEIEENAELESEYHTLFKKVQKEKYIKKGNKYKKIEACTKYRIFIDTFGEKEKGLHKIFNELWSSNKNDYLEIRINSRGGYVNEGAQFWNLINNKFNKRCTTYLDNCGFSMGALLFSMGHKRVITERSELMYHDYSGAVWGKAGEQKAQFEHTSKHIRKFFKDVILDKKFLTKKEFKQMCIGEDFWMGPKELCERGIATHILVNGKEITAKKYLKSLKSTK